MKTMSYTRMDYVRYTLNHRKAFRMIEKQLFGKVSLRGYFHDFDKVILYPLFGKDITSKLHRKFARHHVKCAKTKRDFEQMVVDWECARYTKPDKPMNAYETLYKLYPQLEPNILPILKEVGLIES